MSLPILTGSSSIIVVCIRTPEELMSTADAGPHTQAFWFSRSEVRPETLHFFLFFFLRLCISDKLPGDFDGLVNVRPPKERVPSGGTRWGGGEPGRQQELPSLPYIPGSSGLGWAFCLMVGLEMEAWPMLPPHQCQLLSTHYQRAPVWSRL